MSATLEYAAAVAGHQSGRASSDKSAPIKTLVLVLRETRTRTLSPNIGRAPPAGPLGFFRETNPVQLSRKALAK